LVAFVVALIGAAVAWRLLPGGRALTATDASPASATAGGDAEVAAA
jgi:hypothetical protein